MQCLVNHCLAFCPSSLIISEYHHFSYELKICSRRGILDTTLLSYIVYCHTSFTIIHRLLSHIIYYHTSFTITHHLLSHIIYYHTSFTIIHRLLSHIVYYHTSFTIIHVHRLLSYMYIVYYHTSFTIIHNICF